MTLACEVVLTRTGALAMRDRNTGELMHPVVGPLVEAERLYVVPSRLEARLRDGCERPGRGARGGGVADDAPLVLLDVGLGAGSNAIAAWRVSESLPGAARRLEIVSFDRSVAALELALDPRHAAAFGLEAEAGVAAHALLAAGRHETPRTTWRLCEGDFLTTLAAEAPGSADVVFWDPFSPQASPAHWTVTAFSALRRLCRAHATVHTYSGATSTRSALLLAGFAVGTGDQVGKGRVATAAAVSAEDLASPLDQRWLDRLRRSSAPFPPDAPEDALERIAAMAQFHGG